MGEDTRQRGLLATLVTLLRPCGGIVELFALEACEIAAGQVQQIARQGDDLGIVAGQRFMHQIVVVLIALALVEARHAVRIPAAVAHKTAKEVVAAGNAVYSTRLR